MALDATARRRWLGVLVLCGALGMLLAGETVFKERLSAPVFVLYWLGCFVLTMTAIGIALADARELQRRTRQEHQDLLQTAVKEIETEVRTRTGRNGEPPH